MFKEHSKSRHFRLIANVPQKKAHTLALRTRVAADNLIYVCVVQSFSTSFLKDIHETSHLLIIFNDALEATKNWKVMLCILA